MFAFLSSYEYQITSANDHVRLLITSVHSGSILSALLYSYEHALKEKVKKSIKLLCKEKTQGQKNAVSFDLNCKGHKKSMNRRMDGRTAGWMDGKTDGQILVITKP